MICLTCFCVSTVSRTVPGLKEFVKHSTCLLNCVFYCLVWAASVTLPLGIYQICTDKITRYIKVLFHSPLSLTWLEEIERREETLFSLSEH